MLLLAILRAREVAAALLELGGDLLRWRRGGDGAIECIPPGVGSVGNNRCS